MTLTTAQAFSSFLSDITPTEYQTGTTVPARKKTVDDRLALKFPSTSDMPYWRGILMGSAAKGTMIRPIDDVDVLAVFSNEKNAWMKYARDSKTFLYRVRDAYDGISIQQVGARGQAVRVFFQSGGHVDVAPVFHEGSDVYWLPSGDGSWIRTAPTVAKVWYSAKNQALGYHLSPIVRLLKAWNRAHSKRLRSFHLETLAANAFTSLGSNYRDALHKFFLWAPLHLDATDPAGQGGSISGYLTWSARTEVIQSLNRAADQAGRALDAETRGDNIEAKRLWKIILGDSFPTS
ncbi:hypothetical protein ACFPER_05645 [Agromyces aurantiacus]|uniref:Nucleotidyltransferase n=1 Tax=Agromyces aurantiacus TaxID=165814 RepID=A0ABV9R484_9MICO|nr:hypothetical protein [Agromyces aurantiacus]MBM7502941.1 hypothetical protein [Agromyces aurantiacus]